MNTGLQVFDSLSDDLRREALTHASYTNEDREGGPNNERLEFLGDALLGAVVARELFVACPNAAEGDLTRMRAEIVRGDALASAAERLDLGGRLVLGRGEEAAGGRSRTRNLAGVFEAVVGAVYIGKGLRSTEVFIRRTLKLEIQQVVKDGPGVDPKSALQQLCQARWHSPPEYVTVSEQVDSPERRFCIEVYADNNLLARAYGGSKREAQMRAAEKACQSFQESASADCSNTNKKSEDNSPQKQKRHRSSARA